MRSAGQPSLTAYKTLFMTYLGPQRRKATLMAVLLLTGIALQLVNPQILRYFVDSFTSGGSHANLTLAGALFIGIALAIQVTSASCGKEPPDFKQGEELPRAPAHAVFFT